MKEPEAGLAESRCLSITAVEERSSTLELKRAMAISGTAAAGCLQLLRDERGQDVIEYALVFCFIAFASVALLQALAAKVGVVFQNVATVLTGGV